MSKRDAVKELEAMLVTYKADRATAFSADDVQGMRDAEYAYNSVLDQLAAIRRNDALRARIRAEENAFQAGASMARKENVAWLEGISGIARNLRAHYEAGFRSV